MSVPWTYTIPAPTRWETKVVELREGRFRGAFTPAMLEKMVQDEGANGWEVKAVIDVDKIAGGGKNRGGLLILLQRPAPMPT